ncbi:lipoprotein [Bordetella ansorpii]|uniref:Lipoprotein n=1 Tax=Bordetella ansorpii TaxID=288768 RepID=A0A157SW24_9BORD|nr:DUF4136 domain-containing protein [Bordetella ansorpii]SAI74273.1 lipoprotein [Bordetella ansorpii]
MSQISWSRGLRMAGVSLALGSVLLAGCAAPTVSTHVTSFQRWPQGVQGQSYAFAAVSPEQSNNLEYQSYRDTLRAGLGATGLTEAPAGQPARFTVSYNYGTSQTTVMTRQAYDPYMYGGYPGYYGPRRWGYGFWGPGFWGPEWVDVPEPAFRHYLNVEIRDRERGGAEVYRSSSYTLSRADNLLRAMPYLVRAIFDGFPGNNGSERQIEYPVDR